MYFDFTEICYFVWKVCHLKNEMHVYMLMQSAKSKLNISVFIVRKVKSVRTCMCLCVFVYVCVGVCACAYVDDCVRVRVYMCVRVPMRVRVYMLSTLSTRSY